MPRGSSPLPGPVTERVAAMLREHLTAAGFSVRELAELVGVSRRQMARYLAAERVLDVEELVAVCEALGCDPGALLTRALT